MTNEKILTDDAIHNLIVDFEIECDCGIETYPVDNIVPFSLAIEQAVLQSDKVQEWKRGAERFRKIMHMTRSERKESLFFDWDEDVIKAIDEYK